MEFSLVYRGPLEAAGSNRRAQKQSLRRHFQLQLRELLMQAPLDDLRAAWDTSAEGYKAEVSLIKRVGAFDFVPIVCEKISLIADLEIDLLRPGPFGLSRSGAGDIDNRLKILLDALRMPTSATELPPGDLPTEAERPFFCLLEDDSLIHDISVKTHRWVEPGLTPPVVMLLIRVRTLLTKDVFFGANYGSWMV